ncbi:MAG TPA: lantibiotic dehydratase [Polyangiaceae bacterium]|nr:lantibiotic dehydratase [Polyangiaceae bacterium]
MAVKKGPRGYRPSGFFALRTPLLPASVLAHMTGEPGPRPDDPVALARALEGERAATVARVRAAAAAPEVREALFVASPSLAAALEALPGLGAEAARKVDHAAYRYVARMSARATPFGLFAGCSTGDVGDRTEIALAPRASYRRHVRPDMFALCALAESLSADPATRRALRYVKNPSLYPVGGRLRYSQLSLVGRDTYPLVDVEPTEHLLLALGAAESPASADEVAAAVRAAYPSVGDDEAGEFVDALIENGLLVTALVPTLTGPEPTPAFLDELGRAPGLGATRAAFGAAQAALGRAESAPLGAAVVHYREAVEALREAGVEAGAQRAYQVDLVKPLERGTLGRGAIVEEMARAASLLWARTRPGPSEAMARLMTRFLARYEGREVPLTEALDDDTGLGFEADAEDATPLLEGLALRQPGEEGGGRAAAPDVALRDRLHRALGRREREIEFGPDDLGGAPGGTGPDAFVVLAAVAARSGSAADAGEFELWSPRVIAPSGVAFLARFCHADPALAERLRGHLALEDAMAGDALLADVVHLPSGRLGNIMLRPVLRPYEIVCNGRSGADVARRLPASDLLLSARGGRFFLRSRRLGRRILPRVTNAHNVPRDVTANVYRFLYELQFEGVGPGHWDWGSLADSEFLPRVRSGRTVLSPAAWSLRGERLRAFTGATSARQFAALRALREELALPRWVALAEFDNLLPLDLENPLCVETFAQLARERARVRLTELGPVGGGLVAGPEGAFAHELVVPFVRDEAARGAARSAPTPLLAWSSGGESASGAGRPGAGAAAEGGDAPAGAEGGARTAAGQGAGAEGGARAAAGQGAEGGARAAAGQGAEARAVGAVGGPPGVEAAPYARLVAPGADVLYAKIYGAPSGFDHLVRDVAAPLARRAIGEGAARAWFFVRYRDSDHHLRVRLFGEPARLWGDVLAALSGALGPSLASGRVWRWQLDSYDRETERYGGPGGVLLAERLFHADSEACAEALGLVEDETQRWQAAALGVDALLGDFGLDLGERFAFARRLAEGFGREFGLDGAGARRALEAKVRELDGEAEAVLRGEGGSLAAVRAAYARRSRANGAVVAALRAARGRGELGADDESLLASYVHMHANRLFVASPRLQELVLYSLLARAYRAALARAGVRPP